MEIKNISKDNEGENTTAIPDISWSIQYNKYVTYILAAVGLIGNILSLTVLLLSPKRSNASRLYLIVLAVAESLVLIADIILDSELADIYDAVCKIHYAKYSLSSFSAYIIAVITIQRFVMVKIPFKGTEYDKTKYGVCHLVSAFIFAFASNAFAVPSLGVFDGWCTVNPEYSISFTYSYLVLNYLCSSVGVGILVLILTILTVQGLVKSKTMGVSKKKGETRLTKMLIVLAVTFILLRLPSTIVWLILYVPYRIIKNPLDGTYYKMLIPYYIFGTVTTSNFAINFLIYIVYWSAFRHRLVNIFCSAIGRTNIVQETSTSEG